MLERLGDSDDWGHVLLGLLEQAGWTVTRRSQLSGLNLSFSPADLKFRSEEAAGQAFGGVLLIATGHGTSVSAAGETLAAAAAPLFERVMALRRWRVAA